MSGLILTACEKEIDIDYHDADMRYVVEAFVSNTGTTVRISNTKSMDDNTTGSNINNATVILTTDDGTHVTIPYSNNGFYTSGFLITLTSLSTAIISPRHPPCSACP